ncbi:MAG: Na+/H+ antiporter subunit E [Pseudomonadota bacterium]
MTVSADPTLRKKGTASGLFGKSFVPFLLTFILMFICWIVLSGKFEPLLIGLGLFSSALVAYFFHDLLFPTFERGYVIIFVRFLNYLPWLIWEIVKANFHVLKIVFSPRMMDLIEPQIVTFKTNLESDIAITALANSITLTPGTITVTATDDGVFQVHAIDRESAEALPGTMLHKVAQVFGEQE